jgi:hypothetical protein
MLPLGSIAPGILLPVLAFAYMLYFGACALNRGSKGDESPLADLATEEVRVIITEKSSAWTDHHVFSCNHINPKHDVAPTDFSNHSFHSYNIFEIIKIPEIRIIYEFNTIALFSRPPPLS